jgi:hypothetical protein
MPRIEFEAETLEELRTMVGAWGSSTRPPDRAAGETADGGVQQQPPARTWEPSRFFEALDGLHGKHSLRFLIEVAQVAMNDDEVCNTSQFQGGYGVSTGIAFAGVIGSIHRRFRAMGLEDIVVSRWAGTMACWTMTKEAAALVLEYADARGLRP